MTLTTESLERELELAKELRTRARVDVSPTARLFSEGVHQLTLRCPVIDRDMALRGLGIAMPAVRPTEVYLWTDSHMSNQMVNPLTGEQWGPNEMQAACDGEDLCSTGLITDAMAVYALDHEGNAAMGAAPYHNHSGPNGEDDPKWVDAENAHVVPFDAPEGERLEGFIPDTIASIFAHTFKEDPDTTARREVVEAALIEGFGHYAGLGAYSEVQLRQAIVAHATARALQSIGYIVEVPLEQAWKQRLAEHTLGDHTIG